jgi:hypothetical protein
MNIFATFPTLAGGSCQHGTIGSKFHKFEENKQSLYIIGSQNMSNCVWRKRTKWRKGRGQGTIFVNMRRGYYYLNGTSPEKWLVWGRLSSLPFCGTTWERQAGKPAPHGILADLPLKC